MKKYLDPIRNIHVYYGNWIKKIGSKPKEFQKLWENVMMRSTSEIFTIGNAYCLVMKKVGRHCPKINMNEKNPSKFQFNFPALLGPCPMLKKIIKKKFLPTLEIIQFIRFDYHINGPRYPKFFFGMWHLVFCFTAGSMYLKIWICYLNHKFTSHITGANKRELKI